MAQCVSMPHRHPPMPAEASAAVRHVFRARFLRLRRRTTDGRTDERTDGMSGFALLSAHPESGLIPHATARRARAAAAAYNCCSCS